MKKLQSQGTFNLLRQFCFFEVSTELQQFQQKEGKKLKKSHIIKSDVGLVFLFLRIFLNWILTGRSAEDSTLIYT